MVSCTLAKGPTQDCASPLSSTAASSGGAESTLQFMRLFRGAFDGLAAVWSGDDYCSWGGVRCDVVHGTVSIDVVPAGHPGTLPELHDRLDGSRVCVDGIALSSMAGDLSGTLPRSWGNLTRLRHLVLSNSSIAGSLLDAWSGMRALRSLQLSMTGVSGVLPASWGVLPTLQVLQLDMSELHGSLPDAWASMTALSVLDLSFNHLSGTLPSCWSALHRLVALYLPFNQLVGALPASWCAWTFLQLLELQGNELTGTLPAPWCALTSLEVLLLPDNALSGSLPDAWAALVPSLGILHLIENQFCGCAPVAWSDMGAGWTVDDALLTSDCATANACENWQAGTTSWEQGTFLFLLLVGLTAGVFAFVLLSSSPCDAHSRS